VGTLSLEQFATTEAIQCTEVFEFVRRLTDPTFAMPTLQPYRFLHCLRLAAAGLALRAGLHARPGGWLAEGGSVEEDPLPAWPRHLHTLATSLKYLETLYTTSTGELAERNELPLQRIKIFHTATRPLWRPPLPSSPVPTSPAPKVSPVRGPHIGLCGGRPLLPRRCRLRRLPKFLRGPQVWLVRGSAMLLLLHLLAASAPSFLAGAYLVNRKAAGLVMIRLAKIQVSVVGLILLVHTYV